MFWTSDERWKDRFWFVPASKTRFHDTRPIVNDNRSVLCPILHFVVVVGLLPAGSLCVAYRLSIFIFLGEKREERREIEKEEEKRKRKKERGKKRGKK